jgi:hypothetical protein
MGPTFNTIQNNFKKMSLDSLFLHSTPSIYCSQQSFPQGNHSKQQNMSIHHYQNLVDVKYNVFTYINEDGISYINVLHFDPIIGYQIEWKVRSKIIKELENNISNYL